MSVLLDTIKSDLAAGVSYLENEALSIGLKIWNLLKEGFVALEPQELNVAVDVLTGAIANASASHTIEEIFSAALNTAKQDELAILNKLGSNFGQALIALIKGS